MKLLKNQTPQLNQQKTFKNQKTKWRRNNKAIQT